MMLIYKKIRDLALSKKDREMGCTQKHTMYTAKIKEKIKSLVAPVNWTRFNKIYILDILNNHVIQYPTPISLTYAWSFGSLAGVSLVIQIISGIFLSMHYTPHIDLAFDSVEHIMRDVKNGWLLRYIHANGASMFFIVVYCHIGRGLYYGSYMFPRKTLWCSGVVIFLLMMATAFTGAWVRRVVELLFFIFNPKHTGRHYYKNSILESLLWKWLVTLRILIINSLGFKWTTSGRVKGFGQVSKTFINRLKALLGTVSRLNRVSTFSRTSSLIFKRFRVYPVAKNYIKLVQPKHFTTSTYTFNSTKNSQVAVDGEIRKKALLNKGTRLNNKLALKIQNFSMDVPQTSTFALVQTNKSEHFSLSSFTWHDFIQWKNE